MFPSTDRNIRAALSDSRASMRPTQSDHDSSLSVSLDSTLEAGPSSIGLPGSGVGPSNGHANGNGFTLLPAANGSSSGAIANGSQRYGRSMAKVLLPGTALYDDSYIDREEYIRLVIQSLRDVGYNESAATLEAESGYSLEAPEVTEFRELILDGHWADAEEALMRLCVTNEDGIWEARFLISQQKYLELLEARKTTAALQVLRNELAPLNVDPDQLHSLSSLIMCSDPEDLRQRAGWDGASGMSRYRLLTSLQRHIPSSVMIPQRRFSTLLHQARSYQIQHCVYHNSPTTAAFSLYKDHQCDKSAFPRVTTTILEVHTDEVWNLEWSHDGAYLASCSRDKSAIIWRIGSETEPSIREYVPEQVLRDHSYGVGCLAWSLDDSVLLTCAENIIKLWNAKTGVCIRVLDSHTETVTSLAWLPDGSGFISGALDRRIILWDSDGRQVDIWANTPIRVTDLAVSPDLSRLVVVGMHNQPPQPPANELGHQRDHHHGGETATPPPVPAANATPTNGEAVSEYRMIIYDLGTKQVESSIQLEGELTSVKISRDSQYALINHAPDEIHLWDLNAGRLARKFTGQRQGHHVIRSCFGGIDGNFVVSGSEDANVYVWHRDTGTLLEVLSGHGVGSVNSIAWNPRNERMFASCGDDRSIRIWEAPPPSSDAAIYRQSSVAAQHGPEVNGNGKGKTRQRWDDDGVESNGNSTLAAART